MENCESEILNRPGARPIKRSNCGAIVQPFSTVQPQLRLDSRLMTQDPDPDPNLDLVQKRAATR
eukprot:13892329-Alexandrium_andersonii.AAC.1